MYHPCIIFENFWSALQFLNPFSYRFITVLIVDTVRETLLWPSPYMVAEVDVQVQLRVRVLSL